MARRLPSPPKDADVPGDDDADLFTQAMRDVRRLPADRRERARASRPPLSQSRPGAAPLAPAGDDESVGGFVAPGVDRRELRRMRRGTYPPTARLDLHGDTLAAATTRLTGFLDTSRRGHRCVLIVHGRGLHSAGNRPVLKQGVRALLRTHPAVLAFADAPAGDGGDGAVYVLLRG